MRVCGRRRFRLRRRVYPSSRLRLCGGGGRRLWFLGRHDLPGLRAQLLELHLLHARGEAHEVVVGADPVLAPALVRPLAVRLHPQARARRERLVGQPAPARVALLEQLWVGQQLDHRLVPSLLRPLRCGQPFVALVRFIRPGAQERLDDLERALPGPYRQRSVVGVLVDQLKVCAGLNQHPHYPQPLLASCPY